MGSVSSYIHNEIAILVATSGDVNRHSSSFKMASAMNEWTKKKCVFIRLLWAKIVSSVGSEVLTAVFWDITPCSPLKVIYVTEEHIVSIFRIEE
jgi:hypothetical protein